MAWTVLKKHMTTERLNKMILRRTDKIFDLMGKGKITLQENMEMYMEMIHTYIIKYPDQMREIGFLKQSPLSSVSSKKEGR